MLLSDVNAHVTAPAAAVVVSPNSGWNTTDFSSSQWISASTACGGGGNYLNCLGGAYVYQICWTQTGAGSVSLQFLADNDAVVCLNNPACPPDSSGTVIGGTVIGYDNYLDPTSNFFDPALNNPSISNAATSSGPNTLEVSVGNTTQTPSGLEVQGLLCGNVTLVACPTVSATPTATATPLRLHTVTATPTVTHADCDDYRDRDADCDADRDRDGNADCERHADCDDYRDRDRDGHAESSADGKRLPLGTNAGSPQVLQN